jgi:CRISPR/Cas system CMR-associated protein Cmr5 small subunit
MNMSQKRAKFALSMVGNKKKEEAEELKNYAAKLIALIQTSGFLQSMDFAFNKMKKAHNIIQKWFAMPFPEGPGFSDKLMEAAKKEDFNAYLTSQIDRNEYRRAMEETVALLGWLKSKAEGRKNEKDQPTSKNNQEENDQ